MSGTNLKYFVACKLFFCFCYAVTWYHSSMMIQTPEGNYRQPASFPDTLCVAASWSPVFSGFDIHEGLIYIGTQKFDISIRSQYHRLMSNHQITLGFPVLKEKSLMAGLQCHYNLSALHGVETLHKGSCSGGLIIRPQSDWQVFLYSMHILSFPRDSSEHILESQVGTGFIGQLLPSLIGSLTFTKSANLPWRFNIGLTWRMIKSITVGANYEAGVNHISVFLSIGLKNWRANTIFTMHSYLGLGQQYMMIYER